MIRFLAKVFRGIRLIFGISAPPEGRKRAHVRIGVAAHGVVIGCAILQFCAIPSFSFMH